jgi:hypothetical protein
MYIQGALYVIDYQANLALHGTLDLSKQGIMGGD